MDDLKLLKKKIYEDERVEELLEQLNCHSIKREQSGKLIVAGLPDGTNKRSCQIKNNENLSVNIRSRGIVTDVYGLVGYILYQCETFDQCRENLYQIKTWILNTLDYDDIQVEEKPKHDYNKWLKEIKKQRNKESYILENKVLPEIVLNQYINLPNQWWIDDGISVETQREFEVGFDIASERIVFPVRDKEGNLVGVKSRYVGSDETILNEKKYLYLFGCYKSIMLYNLHRALPYIQQRNQIIVVEGAKTCMILHQWGYEQCISIEGDALTPVQVRLLKELGLDIEIVFAWDKDKSVEFIKKQLKQIRNRNVQVIFDVKGLLQGKDSPCDRGKEIFDMLYKSRFPFKC